MNLKQTLVFNMKQACVSHLKLRMEIILWCKQKVSSETYMFQISGLIKS